MSQANEKTPEERARQAMNDHEPYYYAPGTQSAMVQQWVIPHLEEVIARAVRADREAERKAIARRLRQWRTQYERDKPSSLDLYAQAVLDSAIKIVEDPTR